MSDRAEFDTPKALTAPTRPDRTLPMVILLAVMALLGLFALLPGSEEKAEGLLADGRFDDAIAVLVAVEQERPLDAYEGYMLFKLYMLTSRPDNAAQLLEQQPALQTDNGWALRQLSALYRQRGDIAGEATTLRQLYDINANDADFARLRVLYRLSRDVDNEAALLTASIAAGQATEIHRQRLAYLRSTAKRGTPSTIWTAATGSYSSVTAAPAFYHFAMPATPTTPSLE